MTIKIDIKLSPQNGIDKLAKQLGSLGLMNTFRPSMRQSLDLIREQLRIYPAPSAKGTFLKNATAKQKRAYWAKVRSGEIKADENGKYIRTNRLQKGWKRTLQEIKTSPNGIIGIQPNDARYAGWVQGNATQTPRQQRFHTVTGWSKTIEILERNQNKIAGIFADDIEDRIT